MFNIKEQLARRKNFSTIYKSVESYTRDECFTAKVFGIDLKCYCLFELCINVAMPQEFLCLILLCFVTFFNQITTNSEMNDFFLSLSACSCIYIVSQYIAQINTTRHLCKQHFEDQRDAIHSFR